MCIATQTTRPAAPKAAANNKALSVAAHLDQRAAEAIRGKKGKDVADAFTFAADTIRQYQTGNGLYGTVGKFVASFKL